MKKKLLVFFIVLFIFFESMYGIYCENSVLTAVMTFLFALITIPFYRRAFKNWQFGIIIPTIGVGISLIYLFDHGLLSLVNVLDSGFNRAAYIVLILFVWYIIIYSILLFKVKQSYKKYIDSHEKNLDFKDFSDYFAYFYIPLLRNKSIFLLDRIADEYVINHNKLQTDKNKIAEEDKKF